MVVKPGSTTGIADNQHGALQDVSGNGRVGLGDTYLGDLLGLDGRIGTGDNPGLADSWNGARRKRAEDMMQEQGVPMTEKNVQETMARLPDEEPATPVDANNPHGPVTTEVLPPHEQGGVPVADDGSGSNVAAAIAAAGGALGVAAIARKLKQQQSTQAAESALLGAGDATQGTAQFVRNGSHEMPDGTLANILGPLPSDPNLSIVELPNGEFSVVSTSGVPNPNITPVANGPELAVKNGPDALSAVTGGVAPDSMPDEELNRVLKDVFRRIAN